MAQAAAIGFESIDGFEGQVVSWRRAHYELVALAKKHAGLDFEEGRWLLRAFRAGTHRELGYGSFNEYADRAVTPEIVDMAACDAQQIGRVDAGDDAHVGSADSSTRTRAAQTIPRALRRQVLRRDGGRCQVPGCRHATFVDVHHLELRSEGGANSLANLVTLCGAHHRAIHMGKLSCAGTATQGLTFRHADGTAYGALPVPASAELRAKTYRALVSLGFRDSEAKQALARLPANSSQNGSSSVDLASFEVLLRAALRELAPNRH